MMGQLIKRFGGNFTMQYLITVCGQLDSSSTGCVTINFLVLVQFLVHG